jgi:hypothetical protein
MKEPVVGIQCHTTGKREDIKNTHSVQSLLTGLWSGSGGGGETEKIPVHWQQSSVRYGTCIKIIIHRFSTPTMHFFSLNLPYFAFT